MIAYDSVGPAHKPTHHFFITVFVFSICYCSQLTSRNRNFNMSSVMLTEKNRIVAANISDMNS